MQIDRISLQGFRNLAEATIELGAGVVRVVGRNGQGKSNLFEAIHLLAQGWSYRTRRSSEWIQWGKSSLLVRAEGEVSSTTRKTAISLEENGALRRVRLDGLESSGFSALLGAWPIVMVGPADIGLVQGEPEIRRTWMDALISQYSVRGRNALRRYRQVLRQRNAYLRGAVAQDEELRVVLDETLIAEGYEVVQLRRELIDRLTPAAVEQYSKISTGQESAGLRYRSSWGDGGEETFRERLHSLRQREAELRTTLVGPHRDDLHLSLNGNDFRSIGSQGQQRSMALALQLSAAKELEARFNEPPILLLDDIFCELDRERRRAVGDLLDRSSQVFLAAPEAEAIPFSSQKTLHLNCGVVEEL